MFEPVSEAAYSVFVTYLLFSSHTQVILRGYNFNHKQKSRRQYIRIARIKGLPAAFRTDDAQKERKWRF